MKYIFFLAALVVAGCGRVSSNGPSPGAVDPVDRNRSLIATDAAVLSDQDIDRILTARVEVPGKMRVAVLYLSHDRSREWRRQRDFSEDTFRYALNPVLRLLENDRVFDVSFLPSFLLPDQKSIPLIREAAARYQADWVLIVKTETRDYEKDRVLGKDEARAYCEAECAVLDVRTGTIPYTSVAQGEATVHKIDGEYSLSETSLRAEGKAVEQAMMENVSGLLDFLGKIGSP
jgi:hypothetical protein